MPKQKRPWSYSRISLYEQCPYGYYLQYVEQRGGTDNFYASFGSLIHRLLQQILDNRISYQEAVDYFTDNYESEIYPDAPQNIIDSYFEKGLTYLADVDFTDLFEEFEIVGVEKEVKFKIANHDFIGYIDLLLKSKQSGELVVVDHKSSKYPCGAKGQILKSCAQQAKHYEYQLLLYSKAVKEEFGRYPAQLSWNYFKERKWYSVPFNEDKLNEATEWATGLIDKIQNDNEFSENKDFFYCHNICNHRDSCEYLAEEDNDDSSSSSYDL